ncbi:MAG TPA: acetyl-CoA carboxylase biotin carboxyl carrier protein [Phycisphaerales bacterium]|jgi:acetyl-CoA carboxylase biotin carboxyl carrier protein|nr:acetyl-CoA carboxylase biotin carboxyl carrier protein [Phycisphaerales bacterium]
MIDIRKLKELVRLMVENDLTELDLQDQQETVTVKRGGAAPVAGAPVVYHAPAAAPAPAASRSAPEPAEADEPKAEAEPKDTAGLVPIVSPMVGTVYLAPNPESAAYVASGAAIGPDTTVCLIEAMKVFSEIKAETSGTIERVLVTSGQAVQYGQQLFLVRPS